MCSSDSEYTVGVRILKRKQMNENKNVRKERERKKKGEKNQVKKTSKIFVLLYCLHSHLL